MEILNSSIYTHLDGKIRYSLTFSPIFGWALPMAKQKQVVGDTELIF